MANEVDLQRLVVQMEASFTKYERQWQKAMGVTDANVKKTQAQFNNMAKVVTNAGGSTARGLQPIGMQTANIASQFQDIAVQLQAGQSPFTIALQQGTQLSAALGSGRGLKGTLSALAGAVASLVSPVSLATIGFIALGGVAVQYFATLLQDGKASEEELKKQEDLIRKVAERWGEAVPALKAYVDQLDAAERASEGKEVQAALVSTAWQGARDSVSSFSAFVAEAVTQMQAVGAEGSVINELQEAWRNLNDRVRDGTVTTEDNNRVSAALANAINTVQLPALGNLRSAWQLVAAAILNASQKAASFEGVGNETQRAVDTAQAFIAEQQRINGLTTEQLALETEIGRVKSEAERGDVILTEQQALDLAKERLAAEERRSQIKADTKTGTKAADEARREAEAVLELIAALEFEYDQLGLTTEQQAVANALRQAGAAATDDQRQQIEQLVLATLAERDAQEAVNQSLEDQAQLAENAGRALATAFKDGKITGEELLDILAQVAVQFALMQLKNLNNSGGGNIFTNLLSGILGGFSAGTPNTGGGRGQVRGVVHGQEAVIPLPNGGRVPVEIRVPSADAGTPPKVVNNVFNYGSEPVEQRQNSTGGLDVFIGAAVAKVEKNMASGKYRPLGVGPGVKRT